VNVNRLRQIEAAADARDGDKIDQNGFEVTRLDAVSMREVEWVEKPLLQGCALRLLAGRPDAGKGVLSGHWVARCTTGELCGRPRNVLWLASEDSAEIDLKPRVVVAGGDPSRVHLLPNTVQLPRDVGRIEEYAREIGDVGLIVIDPVANHTAGANTDNDADVRAVLQPLGDLALALGCVVIGIRHVTSKVAPGDALSKILGSSAWIQVPRAVLVGVNDGKGNLHVSPEKGNRVPKGQGGRQYRIEGRLPDGFTESVPCAVPLGESGVDVNELLSGAKTEASGSAVARDRILAILAGRGAMESDALDALVAEEAGVAAKTVRNLRGELKNAGLIRSRPERDESGAVGRWLVERTNAPLPDSSPSSACLAREYKMSGPSPFYAGPGALGPECPSPRESGTGSGPYDPGAPS
jgi:hypothetical protein